MKALIIRLLLLVLFVGLLTLMISYARGYRLNVEQKSITPTGILVASSFPDGAKIYVNGKLRGATNTNITLSPGVYDVEIKKEGYRPWTKSVSVKGEIVIKTDALLFPQNPSLSPLTSLGALNATFSPTSNRIVFISNNADAERDGIYILDTSRRTISLFNSLRLLVLKSALPQNLDLKYSQFEFSPDGKQILFSICPAQPLPTPTVPTTPTIDCSSPLYSYLINADAEKQSPLVITRSEGTIRAAWEKEQTKNVTKILETFKDPMPQIASDSFHILSIAPDDSKILYRAKKSLDIPLIITPPLIGANQARETRTLQKDHLYVYDKKEDKNFEIPVQIDSPSPTALPTQTLGDVTNVDVSLIDSLQNTIIWYPDSRHLIINETKQVSIIDYDGGTRQIVYSGPFDKTFLGVSEIGNLLIVANLNPNVNEFPDIYTVGIR